jgi:hypothetical protein
MIDNRWEGADSSGFNERTLAKVHQKGDALSFAT